MAVYVDTSAWIAIHEPRDRNHQAARTRFLSLLEAQEILVVGWHTLIELADGLVRHYSQAEAAGQIRRILESPRVRVEASEPHLPAARELLQKRSNWNVDLSDCLSFALMKQKALTRAFTYDSDFEKPGFVLEQ